MFIKKRTFLAMQDEIKELRIVLHTANVQTIALKRQLKLKIVDAIDDLVENNKPE